MVTHLHYSLEKDRHISAAPSKSTDCKKRTVSHTGQRIIISRAQGRAATCSGEASCQAGASSHSWSTLRSSLSPVVSAEEVKTCSREARYRDPEPHRSPAKAKRQTPPPVPRVLSAGHTTGTQPEFRSCLIQTGTILDCVRVGGLGEAA